MKRWKQKPDEIIDGGIRMFFLLLGMTLESWDLFGAAWIGLITAVLTGFIICKIRPKHGCDKGIWKQINHFMLTQMDFNSAFSRNKKQPNHRVHSIAGSARSE